MGQDVHEEYISEVIGAGDRASDEFKEASLRASQEHSLASKSGILNEDCNGIVINPRVKFKRKFEITPQTDGVGTKTEIYATAFENLYIDFQLEKINEEEFMEQAIEMWTRCLHDLVAMLADDFRNGSIPIFMTNIMDVNQIVSDPIKGGYFTRAFSQALENVIEDTGVAMLAGETAILGESRTTNILVEEMRKLLGRIDKCSLGLLRPVTALFRSKIDRLLCEIHPNFNGSVTGVKRPEIVFEDIKPGQIIVGLQEVPTESGIIGPRSNGISLIRRTMQEFFGWDWETLTFEGFVKAGDKAKLFNDNNSRAWLQQNFDKLKGKKLWDIATGKTTVFMTTIGQTLLGGIDGKPLDDRVIPKALIHVTGNPKKKLRAPFEGKNLKVDIDISHMPFPPIMAMCQIINGTLNEKASESWNMGCPYAMVIDEGDFDMIERLMNSNGIMVHKIGKIAESESGELEFNVVTGGVFYQ